MIYLLFETVLCILDISYHHPHRMNHHTPVAIDHPFSLKGGFKKKDPRVFTVPILPEVSIQKLSFQGEGAVTLQ